jgi:hypothetical protein
MIENFFGQLQRKFGILTRRSAFADELQPGVFRVCNGLVSFDLQPEGGSPLPPDEGEFVLKHHTPLVHRAAGVSALTSAKLQAYRDGEEIDADGKVARVGGQVEDVSSVGKEE